MSDLKGELQQLADDAARRARPLAIADVIRKGDGKHPWSTTRGSLASVRNFSAARLGWRPAVIAGLATALAAGAATAMLVTSNAAIQPSRVVTVADLADLAATAAATQPGVRPGQWIYRQTVTNSPTRSRPRVIAVERWATADDSKEAYFFHGRLEVGRLPPAVGMLTYSSLGSLPSDPRALVTRLGRIVCPRATGSSLPACGEYQRTFIGISAMLGNYVMPPKTTADLYRALADIPGVRIDNNAVDIAGRHGIGFAYPLGHGTIQELIINRKTYTYMGSYFGTNVPASRADGEALLRQAFVSGPGVRP